MALGFALELVLVVEFALEFVLAVEFALELVFVLGFALELALGTSKPFSLTWTTWRTMQ